MEKHDVPAEGAYAVTTKEYGSYWPKGTLVEVVGCGEEIPYNWNIYRPDAGHTACFPPGELNPLTDLAAELIGLSLKRKGI